MHPITLSSFPEAIVHFDGDAFFTSVEQAVHPELRGRPVVTGKERGIIACASYEAKAIGIRRGVALWEARRRCPELVVLPSDYETYSLYSKRMFGIARRYTPQVEEHSIDEGFADLGGLRRVFRASYEEIARRMQTEVREELGLTVSVGLSLSKTLAKRCSNFRKPRGFTAVAGYHIHLLLQRTPLEEVWGFGRQTTALLHKHGLRTAADFIQRPEPWVERLLGKPGRDLWHELRGEAVCPVDPAPKTDYATISKCKTFTAPITDRDTLYARLVRNVESACIKLRRYRLRARRISVALRRQDYRQCGWEVRLTRASAAPQDFLPAVRSLFERLYRPGDSYRATMVVLGEIEEDRREQYDLFEDRPRIERVKRAAQVMDRINTRYGKHTLGTAHGLYLRRGHGERDQQPWRKEALIRGESERRRVHLPRLDIRV